MIGLGEAIDYLNEIGMDNIAAYENSLLEYGTSLFNDIEGVRIIGNARHKAALISFYVDAAHPHDVVTLLDQDGISCRGGHHCAQPTLNKFGLSSTARASFYLYNTTEDIDRLVEGLEVVSSIFS